MVADSERLSLKVKMSHFAPGYFTAFVNIRIDIQWFSSVTKTDYVPIL